MREALKILVAGPVGAGKSTFIRHASGGRVVASEAHFTEAECASKQTTTVAMDYGRRALGDGDVVAFFGTPGQDRFGFLWPILAKGAGGVVLILRADLEDAEARLEQYFDLIEEHLPGVPVVLGISRVDLDLDDRACRLTRAAGARDVRIPVLAVDLRDDLAANHLVRAMIQALEAGNVPTPARERTFEVARS